MKKVLSSISFTCCVLGTLISFATRSVRADSWIGDAGHFLEFPAEIFANNPEGKAFSVTVHRHIWDTDFGNGDEVGGQYQVSIVDPAGKEAAAGTIKYLEPKIMLQVPAGAKGVYKILYKQGGYALTWVESSLDQMVVGCGDYDMKNGHLKNFFLHVMAPRRWYFFVPQGVKKFEVKHIIVPFQSHREDYGFFVMSPRGQRVAAFYGGKSLELETHKPNVATPIEREIETDEGTAGRFWSIWATGGDSHNFSDLQILLKDVPAFFAPTPEQWFDPTTGKAPEKMIYDDSHVRIVDAQSTKDANGRLLSRDAYLWTPATFLGDEDYNGMRGANTIYLSNPENRPLDWGVETYVVNEHTRFPITYRVTAPDGKVALEGKATYSHRDSYQTAIPPSGGGTYRIDMDASEYFPWTQPTTPVVWAGKPTEDGGSSFPLQTGIARHWFFKVPKGTTKFSVGVSVVDPAHVLLTEIHAPDRMIDVMYVRGDVKQSVNVTVPPGLDGEIWFLRTEVGSATRFLSEAKGSSSSRVRISADITLKGVPGYLAPTWEQWFEPRK